MQFDVFISYAWGGPENTAHREWVRLLAAHLKQIGFHVGIDSEVDYGEDQMCIRDRETPCCLFALRSSRCIFIESIEYENQRLARWKLRNNEVATGQR